MVCELQPESGSYASIVVPVPPSVNTMFRNVAGIGRVKSKLYVAWAQEAGWRLKLQRPPRVEGPVMAVVSVDRAHAGSDIDNRMKAIFDLLVKHEIIEDDSKIVGFAAAWSPMKTNEARVLIFPAQDCVLRFKLNRSAKHGGWFLMAGPSIPQGDD